MDMLRPYGKLVIIAGIIITVIGFLITYTDALRWLGRLPGDIHIRKEPFSFSFPIVTCLILSIVLTLLAYIINKIFS